MSNAAPKLDDATPFPWSQIRAKRIRKEMADVRTDRSQAVGSPDGAEGNQAEPGDALPFDPVDMQAVAVALFGECKVPSCRALLEVDGSCPFASEHPKHECRDCGAEHDAPITIAHPCLFCANTEAAQ